MCRKRGRIRRRPEHNAEIGAALAEGCAVIHPACMLRRQELERLGVRYEEAYTRRKIMRCLCACAAGRDFTTCRKFCCCIGISRNTSHRRRREMHAADERIKAEIREAERRRGQVMDEVRAVETELKALIRRGQREILARRRGSLRDTAAERQAGRRFWRSATGVRYRRTSSAAGTSGMRNRPARGMTAMKRRKRRMEQNMERMLNFRL